MGKVIYDTAKVPGQIAGAYIQVRLKEKLNETDYVIGIKLKPDTYSAPEGSVTNYLTLDLEGAKQLNEYLARCIKRHDRLVESRD